MKYYMGPDTWDVMVGDLRAAGHVRVESLREAEVFINNSYLPGEIPELPENIKFVQHCYAGVNQFIEAKVIRPGGVPWCNAAGAFAQPVAETALALLLSQAHQHKAFALAADWAARRRVDEAQAWLYSPREPKTVAIVGAGGIGRELIRLLEPFHCRIIAVNRSGREVPGADETYPMSEAGHVWPEADFIVSILPLTEETTGILGTDFFAAMKPSALFINVGRGAVVDTGALVVALESGQIAGAALDVMDPEPLPAGHPLYSLPNCTLTPHIGASDFVAEMHMGAVFNANAEAFAAGEPMPTLVNPEAGY
ncbi:D-isomer specific 2-hydroxyacid dehydrogenase family protein [Corynebacterium sp.]|uniref:D-isomer specific 2-hydroxyacid dehydrogenase family protein n=1 Tax=Corynebacterium sp. TaxID=1720 RepID=UPI0026DBE675|nr:D-isomer specific 2-hydroxyacid dehydrogenase family protein [Corynebacterium sp.]MDO5031089.1 D-isomer specific 2-hydroxyacid dehydrogenase family protein [Corynebacterium sp.]